MVRKVLGAVLVCAGLATWTGCTTVDCEWCCTEPGTSIEICGTDKKTEKSRCDDCDFPLVNTYENLGYSCSCEEK